MGVITLMLAARLTVSEFGAVGTALVLMSLGASLADRGIAISILRLPPSGTIGKRFVRRLRVQNLLIAGAAAVAGAFVSDPTWFTIVATAGLLWAVAAEASMARNALLSRSLVRRLSVLEACGGLAALATVGFLADGEMAAEAVVGALILRAAVTRLGGASALRSCLSDTAQGMRAGTIFLSQAASYAIANVDYVIALIALGESALGLYLLAFRASNLVPSQVANAFTPVALNDFAVRSGAATQYHRLLRSLMIGGALGAAATVAATPILPVVLGDRWQASTWLIVLLAVSIPFRLTLGIAGSLLLAVDRPNLLLRWELLRFVGTTSILGVAALGGVRFFTLGVSLAVIISHQLLFAAVARELTLSGIRRWPHVVAVVLVVAIYLVSTSG